MNTRLLAASLLLGAGYVLIGISRTLLPPDYAGMLTTASDLLFTGGREGHFHALDAKTGELLWKSSLGGQIVMAPVTFMVDGKQYVSVISGHVLVTFALRD